MIIRSAAAIFLMLAPLVSSWAGPHEIQATAQVGIVAPDIGASGQLGASFRMDDTWSFDTHLVAVKGFSGSGIEQLFAGTVGATYQLDVTQLIPFMQFSVGGGHLVTNSNGRPTLYASFGVGMVYRWSDRMDIGISLGKASDLGLSESLSPPTKIDLIFRYRFER